MSTDFSGLMNFRRKIASFSNTDTESVAQHIADKGAEIAASKYSGGVTVTTEPTSKGVNVVASGKQVSFLEYGTGITGASAGYEGHLPKQTLTFEIAGETRHTKGWEYNYPNPDTKVTVNGTQGWYFGNTFTTGRVAEAQMWKTSKELRRLKLSRIAQKFIKGK